VKKTKLLFATAVLILTLLVPLFAEPPAAHPVADWIKSAVIYEVNPRTFSATGDFRGIEQRLDYLHDLGVTIVWLMPIHPVGQAMKKGSIGSPYAVQDYYGINPAYGTKDDLKRLVSEAHQRGLKVIIDIVANHTAWDSVLMKHPEFYKKDAQGHIIPPNPDWTDVAGLDYRNPDIVMIAEANKPELLVKAFDLDYAWPFHTTMTNVAENGEPAQSIPQIMSTERERLPKGALEMRFSDDHDEKRAIARFGERGALAASALVFTLEGVPLLYNGMEVGDTTESTAPALFEKLPVFWQIGERRPNFLPFYKQLIALRRAHPALQQGETEWIENGALDRILTYIRRTAGEEYFVAINLSNRPYAGVVNIANGEYLDETPGRDEAARKKVTLPALVLNAWDFRIYRKARE
jgi:glycosidase